MSLRMRMDIDMGMEIRRIDPCTIYYQLCMNSFRLCMYILSELGSFKFIVGFIQSCSQASLP